jgi:hypothetical protein
LVFGVQLPKLTDDEGGLDGGEQWLDYRRLQKPGFFPVCNDRISKLRERADAGR